MVIAEVNNGHLRVKSDCGRSWTVSKRALPTSSIEMLEGKKYKVTKIIYKVMINKEDNRKYHPNLDIINNPGHLCKEYHLILEEIC